MNIETIDKSIKRGLVLLVLMLGVMVATAQTNTNSISTLYRNINFFTLCLSNYLKLIPYHDIEISAGDKKPWLKIDKKREPKDNWSPTNIVIQSDNRPVVIRSNEVWLITFESK